MTSKPFKRGERWYCVVELDRSADGKRRQKWVKATTKREVLAAAAALTHARNTGIASEPSRQTVAAYAVEWLEAERHRLEAASYGTYTIIIRLYLAEHFAATRLDRLTPTDVARWLAAIQARGLSTARVSAIWNLFHHALRDAVRLERITRNPCDSIAPPRLTKSERHTWDEPTARRFLARVADERYGVLYTLIVATGLRRGEVLGLRWEDVDLSRATLTVRQSVTRAHGVSGEYVKGPKSARSRRVITVPAFAVVALRALKAQQDDERAALGDVWDDSGRVFCGVGGAPLAGGTLEWHWRRLRVALVAEGFPYIRFHDLRHLHATLGLAAGIPLKVMSDRLGHSSIGITGNLYSHVTDAMQERAAAALDALINDGDGDALQQSD